MVSWSDGSDSSEHTVEHMSSAFDDGTIKVPASTEDSDFEGPETDMYVLCHGHGKAAERRVSFEGIHTGRRFLCCAEKEDKNYGLVEWIDPSWPNTLGNALSKLWFMYEQSKRDMNEDSLMHSFAIHDLTQEKKKLQASYEKLVEDVNALMDAQEQRAVIERKDAETTKLQEKYDTVKNLAAAQASVIRNMKLKLAEERKNLQIHIDELKKPVEESNVKLEGIKAIING
ncbi:uncharacterized protein [Aegilops tauschii subsp. strangulata]|uniref:uncharacterized protein n=1 Tax=Aegilops tauschii subsp. strangulata TaxID=200361 RepID=UPI001ABBF246|nr:uncharacterized protein LOC109763264 [Aegilops tauschii subsp. strangulata]